MVRIWFASDRQHEPAAFEDLGIDECREGELICVEYRALAVSSSSAVFPGILG